MTRTERRRSGSQPSVSPWIRPVEEPARYKLRQRITDMWHGWRDGRRGIPLLPSDDREPGWEAAEELGPRKPAELTGLEAADAVTYERQPGSAPGPDARRHGPWTPRMESLLREADERIESERISCDLDLAILKRRVLHAQRSVDVLTVEAQASQAALTRAQEPLPPAQRGIRRLAEQDPASRPDELVHARRQDGWDRRLRAAEEALRDVTARLAEATREREANVYDLEQRARVARAAARAHHALGLRRVATYLQVLVRAHRDGPALNDLLMDYRVGPDLPGWAREPEL